jgi:hypothetical protein
VQLGLDNKKKTTWAIALGVLALLAVVFQVVPMLFGPSPTAASGPQPAVAAPRASTRASGKAGKKIHVENLDPTLKLDLLATSEKTQYEGNGRNIFVSQPDPVIPAVVAKVNTDTDPSYGLPKAPVFPPIPLKFYGFASKPGEPKKVFLSLDQDVFVAGEGEIVDRRYKVIRISPNSVEIQDVLNSGPPQNIPLTQG